MHASGAFRGALGESKAEKIIPEVPEVRTMRQKTTQPLHIPKIVRGCADLNRNDPNGI